MRIAFDIDNTLLFYDEWLELKRRQTDLKFPQSKSDFYDNMLCNMGGVWLVKYLRNLGHKIIFVSQPPAHHNVDNISGKFRRMISIFGASVVSDIYLAHDKSLIKCDVLIDDKDHEIDGTLIKLSTNWTDILKQIEELSDEGTK